MQLVYLNLQPKILFITSKVYFYLQQLNQLKSRNYSYKNLPSIVFDEDDDVWIRQIDRYVVSKVRR